MKIVIFTGYIEPDLNANRKIAMNIGRCLADAGHDITIAGFSRLKHIQGPTVEKTEDEKIRFFHITENRIIRKQRSKSDMYIAKNIETKGMSRSSAFKRFVMTHPFAAAVIAYAASPLFTQDVAKISSEHLSSYCAENNIDCIIAVTEPFFSVKAVLDEIVSVPKKIIYQLDPYGLHELTKFEENEPEFFKKADAILTTEVLRERYAVHEDYSPYIDKTYYVPFPSFVKPVISEKYDCLNREKINIVYCGYMIDRYRNPEKALFLLTKLAEQNPDINIHFFGLNKSDVCKKYQKMYPDNVFIHNYVDSSLIPYILESSDMLLNIGNSLQLQLPSKIFEYFATGKPIIHQESSPQCICRKYMKEYPLSYVIGYDDSDDISALNDFILGNRGNKIEWEILKKQYQAYTPEAVSSLIYSIISNIDDRD